MLHEHVIFFEAAEIEQDGEALAGGQPPLRMLGLDPLLPAAEAGELTALFELFDRRCQVC